MLVPALLLLLAAPSDPPDFDTDVLPILAKAGCNAGACHGAAAGRGGFRLSLFGGDPAADHQSIARELESRRVNFAHPGRSLLLLKPTGQLDHEGGQRFEEDSDFARLLTAWIADGAQRRTTRSLMRLAVEPVSATVADLPAELDLAVTAHFSDGSTPHVEHLATYAPADPAATEVSDRGRIRVLRPGRHTIVVRLLTQVVAVQVTAPYANSLAGDAAPPRKNWIDDEINASLFALRLPVSPPADDATLFRRITLDLTGKLPAPEHIRDYLAQPSPGAPLSKEDEGPPAGGPDKFAAAVDRLLASPDFTDYWTYRLSEWLSVRELANDPPAHQAFYQWLRSQIDSRRPLDAVAAALITATGDSHAVGPAGFQRATGDARSQAEHVTETLLGIRIRCANCHNHPLDRWTQDDYHGLAAIFAPLERGREVELRASGEVIHPVTGEPAQRRIPGLRFLKPEAADGRAELAAWITGAENPYFARVWVNRLWESLFGRGLVHPADDLRDTNPATHPALLDRLAADFAKNGYDLRHTLRLLVNSAAYQRSSRVLAGNRHDDRFLSHASRRPLSQAVLVRSLCQVTGVPGDSDHWVELRGDKRELRPRQPIFDPLAALACAANRDDPQAGNSPNPVLPPPLDQVDGQLQWLNGPLVNGKLADPRSALSKLALSNMSTKRLVEEYYLRTLSRPPTTAEAAFWQAELAGSGRSRKCEDFAWSLLSCPDFVTNH